MLHSRLFKGGLSPNNNDILRSIVQRMAFFALFLAILVVLPLAPAQAQPFTTSIATLRDAINGNATARNLIAAEAYTTVPCFDPYNGCTYYPFADVDNLVANVTATLGGAAAATNLINQALAGNAAAVSSLHAALGGNYAATIAPIQGATDIMNTWVAGGGDMGLRTLSLGMGGNGSTLAVLNILFDGNANAGLNFFRSLLGVGTVAQAQAVVQEAIDGDSTALYRVAVALYNLQQGAAPILDIVSNSWLSNILVSIGGIPPLPDSDGDGVIDINDRDVDGDGIPDYLDPDYTGPQYWVDANNPDIDPIYRQDDDGDGIPNGMDQDWTPPAGTDITDGNNAGTSPMGNCDTSGAVLTGSYAISPCQTTQQALPGDMSFASMEAGQRFAEFINQWWTTEMLPRMRDMTAQLHSGVVDQTRQIGSMFDSQNMTRSARNAQEVELQAKKELQPNEQTCVSGSYGKAMSHTHSAAQIITQGFKNDIVNRSGSVPGQPSQSGPAADQRYRWEQYCTMFHNPDANRGQSACPNPGTAGTIVDGDVDIEGVLLKDTLDLAQPEQYAASLALMRNLIQPKTYERIPDNVINTAEGRERLLKIQHLKAVRNIASDVVANIISRRAAIELPDVAIVAATPPPPPVTTPPVVDPPGTPSAPPSAPGSAPARGSYDAMLAVLRQRESTNNYASIGGDRNNFLGAYQMGGLALIEAGCIVDNDRARNRNPSQANNTNTYTWTGRCGNSRDEFLTGPNAVAIQDAAIKRHNQALINQMRARGMQNFHCQVIGGVLFSPSGMIAAAHLIGAGALNNCIRNPGASGCSDAFGTHWRQYMTMAENYESPWGGACDGSSPAPATPDPGSPQVADLRVPRPARETIREIRERAGVPPSEIAENPSYNEIMLALTKERFFDPKYFINMNNNLGAIRQEQTAINAYISIMMQDIYNMQERINALLAARAALGYGKIPEKTATSQNPNR